MLKLAAFITLAASFAAISLAQNDSYQNQNLSAFVASLTLGTSPTDPSMGQTMTIAVENCGDAYSNISARFRQSRTLVLRTLSDSVFGTRSYHGFKSMFKNNSARLAVEAILDGIYYRKLKLGLNPGPNIPKGPRLSCVTTDSAQIYENLDLGYDPWQRCWGSAPERIPVPAFYADGTAYVFLCPAFFALEETGSQTHCPIVQGNIFTGDPDIFYRDYQTYTMIYYLIRFYLGDNALNQYTDPPEQLDWNACVRLGSKTILDSIRNPTSFQLYIALVSQRCNDVPEPPPYFSPSTELESLPSESASHNPWPFATASPMLNSSAHGSKTAPSTGETQTSSKAMLELPGNALASDVAVA